MTRHSAARHRIIVCAPYRAVQHTENIHCTEKQACKSQYAQYAECSPPLLDAALPAAPCAALRQIGSSCSFAFHVPRQKSRARASFLIQFSEELRDFQNLLHQLGGLPDHDVPRASCGSALSRFGSIAVSTALPPLSLAVVPFRGALVLLAPLLAGPEIVVAVLLEDGVLPVVGLGVALAPFARLPALAGRLSRLGVP